MEHGVTKNTDFETSKIFGCELMQLRLLFLSRIAHCTAFCLAWMNSSIIVGKYLHILWDTSEYKISIVLESKYSKSSHAKYPVRRTKNIYVYIYFPNIFQIYIYIYICWSTRQLESTNFILHGYLDMDLSNKKYPPTELDSVQFILCLYCEL